MPLPLFAGLLLATAAIWYVIRRTDPVETRRLSRYKPFSAEARTLFEEAARFAKLPVEWASTDALHRILEKESNGWVGIPNYTYGTKWGAPKDATSGEKHRVVLNHRAEWPIVWGELRDGRMTGDQFVHRGKTVRSSATGLGQMTLPNVDEFYPSHRVGIGDPLEEAVGMLRYLHKQYNGPENALAEYGLRHGEGY